MSIKKKLATALTTCAMAMAMGATAALADSTVTYNYTFADATTNWSTVITIPRFNTSLGSLSSIDFALAGELLGTVLGHSEGSVTASLTGGLYIPDAGLSAVTTVSGGGIGGGPFPLSGPLPSTSGSVAASAGTGDESFTVQGNATCTTTGTCTAEVGGTVDVTAHYVPEPASLALLGLGLAALGAGTRRRRAS